MDPIPLSKIFCLIDMEYLPIFALLIRIEEGLFSKGGEQIYLIQPNDQYSKKSIINNIIESCPINIVPDPIFKSLVLSKDGVGPVNAQIVGASTSEIRTRSSRFTGETRISKPYLMLINESTMKFYKINYKYWTFIGREEKPPQSYEDAFMSTIKKKDDTKKLTNKQLDEIMKNLLVEEKSLTYNIGNLINIREKEDKEPILLLSFPKNKLHMILSSDFGLQSLSNTLIQVIKSS